MNRPLRNPSRYGLVDNEQGVNDEQEKHPTSCLSGHFRLRCSLSLDEFQDGRLGLGMKSIIIYISFIVIIQHKSLHSSLFRSYIH